MNQKVSIIVGTVCAAVCINSSALGIITLDGPVVNPANGHSYYLLSDSTWTDAEAFAQTLGGHLATINNASEDTWVYDTFSLFGGESRTLWIGLNDVETEGNFVWSSGEPVTYTNWQPGEPNNYFPDEDYVFIYEPTDAFGRAGRWNDADNIGTKGGASGFYTINGVVEVVPEPTTFAMVGVGAVLLTLRRLRRK